MLARIRKALDEKDQGFTLIELLVVMIIIGILAAIAIPAFLSQRKKAVESSMKSDLRTTATELESYYTDAQAYPVGPITSSATTFVIPDPAGGTEVTNVKISNPATVLTYTLAAGGESYCVVATSPKAKSDWHYDSAAGGLAVGGTCS